MVIDIFPGVKLYKDDNISICFGVPPEIIKFLQIKKQEFPDVLVLPDTLFQDGNFQIATEFPLYYHLFILGNFFKNKKLIICGNKETVLNNKKLLNLTLLGPSENEYKKTNIKKDYQNSLYKESRYSSLKLKNGKEAKITDLVDFKSFEKENIKIGNIEVKHIDTNIYKINNEIIDINFNEKQIPLYNIQKDFISVNVSKFGVNVLGGGSGFTPNKSCSSLLVNYNYEYMLIDSPPYLNYHLKQRGISNNQIRSIFMSHIHDDHCNIFSLLLTNDKLNFLSTREIFWMTKYKLSLLSGHPIEEFDSYFNFIELTPYEDNFFYGINIHPHYTVHSIPTIGAKFSINDHGNKFSFAFTGDNKKLSDIKKMVNANFVNEKKYKYLYNLYKKEKLDLLFADGGGGILHGDPQDTIDSKSKKIVFLHLEDLNTKYNATYSVAEAGKKYVLEEGTTDPYIVKTTNILYNIFPDISSDWLNALMSNVKIDKYNSGDIIFKQKEKRSGYIYIILSGCCKVVKYQKKKLKTIAVKDTGDFIGEMAIIRGEDTRSASVIADTPVILCKIDENIFYKYLRQENKIENFKEIWNKRSIIEKLYPFSEFSDQINEKISKYSKVLNFKKDSIIIKEGEKSYDFFIILKGKVDVIIKSKIINNLSNGAFFGEFAGILDSLRIATIKTKTDSKILRISGNELKNILLNIPKFNFILHDIMIKRDKKNKSNLKQ